MFETAQPVDRSGRLTPSVEAVMEAIFDNLDGSRRDGDFAVYPSHLGDGPVSISVRHMAEFLIDRFIRRR